MLLVNKRLSTSDKNRQIAHKTSVTRESQLCVSHVVRNLNRHVVGEQLEEANASLKALQSSKDERKLITLQSKSI